jgi:hypothetical protein
MIANTIPAHARSKPKPPPIEVCYGGLCVTDLRWPERLFGGGLAAVQGILVNNSPTAFTNVTIHFDTRSGTDLRGTAGDYFMGQIPPGGRWAFTAMFASSGGQRVITRIESGLVQGWMLGEGTPQRLRQPLQFDPLFSPLYDRDRKEWEKIHGARQR